jgi:predicted Rossmann-fold nucleotide-binding protein
VEDFYDPLLALFDRAVTDGFIKPPNRELVVSRSDAADLLHALREPLEPTEPEWIRDVEQT